MANTQHTFTVRTFKCDELRVSKSEHDKTTILEIRFAELNELKRFHGFFDLTSVQVTVSLDFNGGEAKHEPNMNVKTVIKDEHGDADVDGTKQKTDKMKTKDETDGQKNARKGTAKSKKSMEDQDFMLFHGQHIKGAKRRKCVDKLRSIPSCFTLFSRNRRLTEMMNSRRPSIKCPFPTCPKILATSAQLAAHINAEHTNVAEYRCQKCPYTCHFPSSLTTHLKNMHLWSAD